MMHPKSVIFSLEVLLLISDNIFSFIFFIIGKSSLVTWIIRSSLVTTGRTFCIVGVLSAQTMVVAFSNGCKISKRPSTVYCSSNEKRHFFKVVLAFFENDESFANDNNAGYCSFIRSIMYNVEFHPVATSMINL